MENIRKSYIKDKTTGTYESDELSEKVLGELIKPEEKPKKEQDAVDANTKERKRGFGK